MSLAWAQKLVLDTSRMDMEDEAAQVRAGFYRMKMQRLLPMQGPVVSLRKFQKVPLNGNPRFQGLGSQFQWSPTTSRHQGKAILET